MNINFLEVQGFKSYQKKQRFYFNDLKAGLYFVTGENLLNPEMGANAVGKSPFFSDAFMWMLSDKTSLNLKASNIKNWNTKIACEGILGFEKNGIDYEIYRSWNPNRLEISKRLDSERKPISQEALEDLIGFNFSSALHSIILSQFSSKFFDLRPEEKLKIFSDILGDVDKWLDYSKKASLGVDSININISNLQRELENKDGQIQALEEQDYEQRIKDWDFDQNIQIKRINQNIKGYILDIEYTIEKIEEFENIIDDLDSKIKEGQQTLDLLYKEVDDLEDIEKDLDKKIIILKSEISINKKNRIRLENVGGVCSNCNQKVSKQHIKKELHELDIQINKQELSLDKNLKCLEIANKNADNKAVIANTNDEVLKNLEQKERDTTNKMNSLVLDLRRFEDSLRDSKNIIKEEKDKVNPYQSLKDVKALKIDMLEKQLKTIEKDTDTLESDKIIQSYWIKGFKEIRLLVVKEALAEFEIHVNNNLQRLGLSEWKIRFDVDRETKSKTIQKGFYGFVESPQQKKSVLLECYGGGERGRLRLAGSLGLIDFISSRKGSSCDVEIWDEPTTHLSPEGIEDLIEILFLRAKEYKKKILLIDHCDLRDSGEFTDTITVIKDENGSRIEY